MVAPNEMEIELNNLRNRLSEQSFHLEEALESLQRAEIERDDARKAAARGAGGCEELEKMQKELQSKNEAIKELIGMQDNMKKVMETRESKISYLGTYSALLEEELEKRKKEYRQMIARVEDVEARKLELQKRNTELQRLLDESRDQKAIPISDPNASSKLESTMADLAAAKLEIETMRAHHKQELELIKASSKKESDLSKASAEKFASAEQRAAEAESRAERNESVVFALREELLKRPTPEAAEKFSKMEAELNKVSAMLQEQVHMRTVAEKRVGELQGSLTLLRDEVTSRPQPSVLGELHQAQQELQNAQRELSGARVQLERLPHVETELAYYKRQSEKLEKAEGELNSLRLALERAGPQEELLRRQLDTALQRADAEKEDLDKARAHLKEQKALFEVREHEWVARLEEKEKQCRELQRELSTRPPPIVNEMLHQVEQEAATLKTKLEVQSSHLEDFARREQEMETRVRLAESASAALREELATRPQPIVLDKLTCAEREVAALGESLEDLRRENDVLRVTASRLGVMDEELVALRYQIEKYGQMESEFTNLRREAGQMELDLMLFKTKAGVADDLHIECESLRKRTVDLQSEVHSLARQVSEQVDKLNEYKRREAELLSRIESDGVHSERLREQLASMSAELSQRPSPAVAERLDLATAESARLARALQEQESLSNTLKAEIGKVTAELEILRETTRGATDSDMKRAESLQKENQDLHRRLKKIREDREMWASKASEQAEQVENLKVLLGSMYSQPPTSLRALPSPVVSDFRPLDSGFQLPSPRGPTAFSDLDIAEDLQRKMAEWEYRETNIKEEALKLMNSRGGRPVKDMSYYERQSNLLRHGGSSRESSRERTPIRSRSGALRN